VVGDVNMRIFLEITVENNYKIKKGKIFISHSNYHPIENVSPKLSIETISSPNYQKIINVPPKP
jgi:hypothetical protein